MTLQGNHQDLLGVSHTFMCLVFSAWSDGRCENPVRILCINHNREPVLGLVGRDTALAAPEFGYKVGLYAGRNLASMGPRAIDRGIIPSPLEDAM